MDNQKLKSDVTEADINNTITNMASLLEQSWQPRPSLQDKES